MLSVLLKVGRDRLPAFSKRLWFICVPALKSEMRKKVFCSCTRAVLVLLCDVLVSFDTEEGSVFQRKMSKHFCFPAGACGKNSCSWISALILHLFLPLIA